MMYFFIASYSVLFLRDHRRLHPFWLTSLSQNMSSSSGRRLVHKNSPLLVWHKERALSARGNETGNSFTGISRCSHITLFMFPRSDGANSSD